MSTAAADWPGEFEPAVTPDEATRDTPPASGGPSPEHSTNFGRVLEHDVEAATATASSGRLPDLSFLEVVALFWALLFGWPVVAYVTGGGLPATLYAGSWASLGTALAWVKIDLDCDVRELFGAVKRRMTR